MTSTTQTRPVVAGIDGSPASRRAARTAAQEARRRTAPLRLVSVLSWPLDGSLEAESGSDLAAVLRAGEDDVLAAMAGELTGGTDGIDVTREVVSGNPVEVLRAASAEAQLVVLGSRGAGGVAGLIMGSTANGVVAAAEGPVLVVPDDVSVRVRQRRSVVVGVEGTAADDDVLAFAFGEAAARETDVVAVHVWQDVAVAAAFQTLGPLVDWAAVAADEERVLAEALAGWRDEQPDVVVREVVLRDKTARGLLAAALTAQLLVVGHRRRGPLSALGSTTHGVLHRSGCPVAVVPLGRDQGR